MIHIGKNMKLTALESDRARVRAFYGDLLGGARKDVLPDMDVFVLPDGMSIGVAFTAAGGALEGEDAKKSAWLELVVDDVDRVVRALGELAVKPFDYVDKTHVYFHAPGGQVFRLAKRGETR